MKLKLAIPGPWHLGSQNDQLYVTAGKPPAQDNDHPNHDADRTLIAKVYGDAPTSDEIGRLLAAAPQLLKAVEFAEYMATSAEYLLDIINRNDWLIDNSDFQTVQERRSEAISALRNDIYEFRKRVPE